MSEKIEKTLKKQYYYLLEMDKENAIVYEYKPEEMPKELNIYVGYCSDKLKGFLLNLKCDDIKEAIPKSFDFSKDKNSSKVNIKGNPPCFNNNGICYITYDSKLRNYIPDEVEKVRRNNYIEMNLLVSDRKDEPLEKVLGILGRDISRSWDDQDPAKYIESVCKAEKVKDNQIKKVASLLACEAGNVLGMDYLMKEVKEYRENFKIRCQLFDEFENELNEFDCNIGETAGNIARSLALCKGPIGDNGENTITIKKDDVEESFYATANAYYPKKEKDNWEQWDVENKEFLEKRNLLGCKDKIYTFVDWMASHLEKLEIEKLKKIKDSYLIIREEISEKLNRVVEAYNKCFVDWKGFQKNKGEEENEEVKKIKDNLEKNGVMPLFDINEKGELVSTDSYVKFSLGGLHGAMYDKKLCEKEHPEDADKYCAQMTYRKPYIGKERHADFTSYYPNMLIGLEYSCRSNTDRWIYKEILDKKNGCDEEKSKIENDKQLSDEEKKAQLEDLEVKRSSYKLILNSLTGKLQERSQKDKTLIAPNMIVSMRIMGNLFMWMLAQELTLAGAKIINVNTDGLYYFWKPGDKSNKDEEICDNFGEEIGVPIKREDKYKGKDMYIVSYDSNQHFEYIFEDKDENGRVGKPFHATKKFRGYNGPELEGEFQMPCIVSKVAGKALMEEISAKEAYYKYRKEQNEIINKLRGKAGLYEELSKELSLYQCIVKPEKDTALCRLEGKNGNIEFPEKNNEPEELRAKAVRLFYVKEKGSAKNEYMVVKRGSKDKTYYNPVFGKEGKRSWPVFKRQESLEYKYWPSFLYDNINDEAYIHLIRNLIRRDNDNSEIIKRWEFLTQEHFFGDYNSKNKTGLLDYCFILTEIFCGNHKEDYYEEKETGHHAYALFPDNQKEDKVMCKQLLDDIRSIQEWSWWNQKRFLYEFITGMISMSEEDKRLVESYLYTIKKRLSRDSKIEYDLSEMRDCGDSSYVWHMDLLEGRLHECKYFDLDLEAWEFEKPRSVFFQRIIDEYGDDSNRYIFATSKKEADEELKLSEGIPSDETEDEDDYDDFDN